MYYNTCQGCGANLDPDEKCDCYENISAKEIMDIKQNCPCESNIACKIINCYRLGYTRAKEKAALDADTSKSGTDNAAISHETQLYSSTVANSLQEGVNDDGK